MHRPYTCTYVYAHPSRYTHVQICVHIFTPNYRHTFSLSLSLFLSLSLSFSLSLLSCASGAVCCVTGLVWLVLYPACKTHLCEVLCECWSLFPRLSSSLSPPLFLSLS